MKEVKKKNSPIFQMLGKVLESEADKVSRSGWPPICAGFLHQPKRPIEKK